MTERPTDYSLKLLGAPSLTSQTGGALPGLGPGKSLAMLAFLTVRGQARRDELISLLWGEIAEDKARNAFRQSLHRLRSSLGESILPQDRDVVSIGDRSRLRCDRDQFVLACDERRWQTAAETYSGDFLEGFEVGEPVFDRWADAERIKLRSRFETALRHATTQALDDGLFPEAILYAGRLSANAPFDEQAATLEATVLVAAGRPEEAAAVTRRFVQRLQEELELEPSPELRALLTRLQRADTRRKTPSHDHDANRPIPFVGRDAEISRLIASLGDLASEQGSTVVVQGVAGIGKSRLIEEFASRARNLGPVHVLRGREHSLVTTIPYASVAEALRPLVHAPGVAGTSKHLLAEAARLLPELRDSFELPELAWVDDEASRLRFFEGVAALIDGAAYERPVCIALDDMHHASASTLELVSYLAGRLRTSPVLLMIAYQPDSSAAHATERLARLADAARDNERFLILGPLDPNDSASLVRAVMIRDDRLPPQTLDRIARAANGRPMELIELTRRALAGESGGDAVTSLKDVLWGRLQATSPSQRRVFFAASLFERHASIGLLAAAAHLPEAATVDAVSHLVSAGLLQHTDAGFTVAHDTTATFLTDSSGLAGRSMLADWAADALAHEADATDAELANLYALAGRSGKAFEHARKGAFAAGSMGASAEALRLLNVALTFAPDDRARTQIESLVTAFGNPSLRLAAAASELATEEQAAEPEATDEPFVADAAAAPPAAPSIPEVARPRPLLTHASARQWMLSIGLSLLITLLGLATRRDLLARRPAVNAIDSLVLVEHGGREDDSLRIASGDVGPSPLAIGRLSPGALAPAWVRTLNSPWTDPVASPDGRFVALERVTGHGTDLYVVTADLRDTVPIAVGGPDNAPLAWSPDSRFLLVSRARSLNDGTFDSDLYSYSADGKHVAAIDTSASRSIVDARWSPTGTLVAWVARAGASRQQEIYVSAPDGTGFRNLTANPAEDFHPAWSPDGTLLAFTSTRSGARRIFAYDFENSRVWPVTDRDGDDEACFSPDGRYLAFESTRDGDAAIYISRPLGGTATRITPRGRQFSIAEWRGRRAPYIDRLRIVGPSSMTVGDITKFSYVAVDQYGAAVNDAPAAWSLDARGPLVRADSLDSDTSATQSLRAARTGEQVLVAGIAGWRSDSLRVAVSPAEPLDLRDDFARGLDPARWQAFGVPLPYVGRIDSSGASALYPNGDLEWESGVLSQSAFALVPGLAVSARVFAPFGGRASSASLELALVAADGAAIDRAAPRFSPLLRAAWDGQAGALTYTVGAQSSTDHIGSGGSHTIRLSVESGGAVTFYVDDQPRWHTSLRYLGDVSSTRVRLWIGGRATGNAVAVGDVSARDTR